MGLREDGVRAISVTRMSSLTVVAGREVTLN